MKKMLSREQREVLDMILLKGSLMRYKGEVWSFANVIFDGCTPEWHADVNTLNSLDRLGFIILDEAGGVCHSLCDCKYSQSSCSDYCVNLEKCRSRDFEKLERLKENVYHYALMEESRRALEVHGFSSR